MILNEASYSYVLSMPWIKNSITQKNSLFFEAIEAQLELWQLTFNFHARLAYTHAYKVKHVIILELIR